MKAISQQNRTKVKSHYNHEGYTTTDSHKGDITIESHEGEITIEPHEGDTAKRNCMKASPYGNNKERSSHSL
jgi:hypothetical protein